MIINQELLDSISIKAKGSERLRFSYDLRTTPNDTSQRVLNALEPGTIVPIHRHRLSSEVVVLLRGSVRQHIYDDNGKEIDTFVVSADGYSKGFSIDRDVWHNTECLEPSTVFLEAKDGTYAPLSKDEIMTL